MPRAWPDWGMPPLRPAGDVPAGGGRRTHRRQPDRPPGAGAALRQLDAGPADGVPGRGERPSPSSAAASAAILQAEGLRWRQQETLVRRAARSGLRRKKGAIVTLYTAPPAESIVICLDEMGPESAKSFPGGGWCARAGERARPPGARLRAARARLRLRRLRAGHRGGADQPYPRRTTAHFVDFLDTSRPGSTRPWSASTPSWTTCTPPRPRCPALGAGPPPLGVRLPTHVRRLPEPDRAVVEVAALPGVEGARFATWDGSARRWPPPPATGTPTATRSSGAAQAPPPRPPPGIARLPVAA